MAKFLSFSQASAYLNCPEYWHYCYVLNIWPPRDDKVALKFGEATHYYLAKIWEYRDFGKIPAYNITWGNTEKERSKILALAEVGMDALKQLKISLSGYKDLFLVEKSINYLNLTGTLDLAVSSDDSKSYVIDWKTTSEEYENHIILTSEQLTLYAMLFYKTYGFLPDYVAIITLNKNTGAYTIYLDTRDFKQIDEYDKKLKFVKSMMDDRVVYKNPNNCYNPYGKCFFYSRCWEDRELVKIRKYEEILVFDPQELAKLKEKAMQEIPQIKLIKS